MLVWKIPANSKIIVTYPYGIYDRNLNKTSDGKHHGVDMVIEDKKVISASHGKVIFAGWNNDGYGNLVMVQNGSDILYYAHLKSINVSYGENVNYLTQIGIQGASGYVTGEHLHFEVRRNGQVINAANYMGIPNNYGEYYPQNYAFEDIPKKAKYSVGQLVVFNKYHSDFNNQTEIDCIQNDGSWLQAHIIEVRPECNNTYKLEYNRYINDSDVREVK